jgi:hypothetical protein
MFVRPCLLLSVWTGYYSTRPFDKRFSREVESNLRSADILNTLALGYCRKWNVDYSHYHESASLLQQARRHLGLFLHHDAITGTSKDYVKAWTTAFLTLSIKKFEIICHCTKLYIYIPIFVRIHVV